MRQHIISQNDSSEQQQDYYQVPLSDIVNRNLVDFIDENMKPNEFANFIQSNDNENLWTYYRTDDEGNDLEPFTIITDGYDNNNNLKLVSISFSIDFTIPINHSLYHDIYLFDTENSSLKIQIPEHDELWLDNNRYTEIWMPFSVYPEGF